MKLLEPYNWRSFQLKNRMVMAPMTRGRAVAGNVPNPAAAQYYAERASAGLIVTEATQVSPQGIGYVRTPGIHSAEQVEGWRKVTESVHQAGGRIFLQIFHVGRISHPDFHNGELPVAPSAIKADGEVFTYSGKKPMETPRALETREIAGIIEQFRQGAANAKKAGFDGIEIHGANGYLLDQFLRDGTNLRTDAYGGDIDNRLRLPLEVTEAVIDVWGADRVGYRISPNSRFNSMSDSNPLDTFSHLTRELSMKNIAYLHVVEGSSGLSAPPPEGLRLTPLLRKLFEGTYVVNDGYDRESAERIIEQNLTDLVSFGIPFLANPDLPRRFATGALLNKADMATLYTGDEKGYVDYPILSD
jgi:N-ethylmaleimide reductase